MAMYEPPAIRVEPTPEHAQAFATAVSTAEGAAALHADLQSNLKGTLAGFGITVPDALLEKDVQLPTVDELRQLAAGSVPPLIIPLDDAVYFLHPIIHVIFCMVSKSGPTAA